MNKIVRGCARRVLAIGATTAGATFSPEEVLAPDGMLIVMESDPARAEALRHRFSSGHDGRATVIAGDPRRLLYKLAGPFDMIFCGDADAALREKLERLLAPNGVFITNDKT